jgi:nucleotide-binding universal stress UspA family protein
MVLQCSPYLHPEDIGGKVMTRILVPTDFSEPSLAAVRSGIELADAVGGVVFLLHVVEWASVCDYVVGGLPLYFSDMIDLGGQYFRSPLKQQLIRRDFWEEARWKLDALVPPSSQARIHTLVTVGRVVDEIVRVAKEQHADLILLGAHGLRGWRHVFRRTMADRVRRKASIPVVTLDANDLRGGGDSRRRDVPDQQIGSGRTVAHSPELVGAVKDKNASHNLPSVESPSLGREGGYDSPKPPELPHSANRDERAGREANKRSRKISV